MKRHPFIVIGPEGRLYLDTLASREEGAQRKYLKNRSVPETATQWKHEVEDFGVRVAAVKITELVAADPEVKP